MDVNMSKGNGCSVTMPDYLDYRSDISDVADWNLMNVWNIVAHLPCFFRLTLS